MANINWQPLPSLWPSPAVSTDVGGFILLVFTEHNLPTWEVRRKAKKVDGRDDDLVASGTLPARSAATTASKSSMMLAMRTITISRLVAKSLQRVVEDALGFAPDFVGPGRFAGDWHDLERCRRSWRRAPM
jgi:hypothetical protein